MALGDAEDSHLMSNFTVQETKVAIGVDVMRHGTTKSVEEILKEYKEAIKKNGISNTNR